LSKLVKITSVLLFISVLTVRGIYLLRRLTKCNNELPI